MKFLSREQIKLFCMASSSEIRDYSCSKALVSVAVRTQLMKKNTLAPINPKESKTPGIADFFVET